MRSGHYDSPSVSADAEARKPFPDEPIAVLALVRVGFIGRKSTT